MAQLFLARVCNLSFLLFLQAHTKDQSVSSTQMNMISDPMFENKSFINSAQETANSHIISEYTLKHKNLRWGNNTRSG